MKPKETQTESHSIPCEQTQLAKARIWHVPIPLNESHVPIPLNEIHPKTKIGSRHENLIVAVTTFGSPLAISKNQIISCRGQKYLPNVKIYQLLWPLLEACGQPRNAKDPAGNENMLQTWKSNVCSAYLWKASSGSQNWDLEAEL